jgi:hypothetical protein
MKGDRFTSTEKLPGICPQIRAPQRKKLFFVAFEDDVKILMNQAFA